MLYEGTPFGDGDADRHVGHDTGSEVVGLPELNATSFGTADLAGLLEAEIACKQF